MLTFSDMERMLMKGNDLGKGIVKNSLRPGPRM